jgi:flagellar export protein FliJ
VKRFEFRLQSVLDWRARQLEMEQAKLQALFKELHGLDAALARLQAEGEEAARVALASGDPQQLAALGPFREHLRRERGRVEGLRAACETRLAGQRNRTLEAERNVRLLERLKGRRLADWNAAASKELELLATDSFLARWSPPGVGVAHASACRRGFQPTQTARCTGFPRRNV